MEYTPAFDKALQAARTFSLKNGINYISSHLICCAAIEHSPAENAFMSEDDKAIFLQQLFAEILAQPKIAAPAEEVPLTQDAQVMAILAGQYMHAFGEEALDIPHYLLAVLSSDTRATQLLKERGWVFKNYLDWLTATKGVAVEFPDQLYPATDFIPRRRKLPYFKRMLDRTARAAEGRQYLDDSLQLVQYKDYERAYQSATLAAKHAVRDEIFYVIKVHAEVKSKRFREALKTVEEARRKGLSEENFYLNEAYCHYELGALDKCIAVCEAYLPAGKKPSDAYNMMGFVLAKQERHAEAIACYDQVLQAEPQRAFALNNKGFSLFKLGHIDEAIDLINASLSVDKGNSYAYRNLALIAENIGQPDMAKALAEKAILFGYRDDYGSDLDNLLLRKS